MFNRDGIGLVPTEFVCQVKSTVMDAVAQAYSRDILLPHVVLVGRQPSLQHGNAKVVIGQNGRVLTMDDRRRIAEARKHILQDEEPDFTKDAGEAGTGAAVENDAFLPKTFRIVKATELDLETVRKDPNGYL